MFHIQYANIEATLPTWRAKTLLKTVVPRDLGALYHEFGITDITTLSDLSYDQAESILRTMKEEKHSGAG